MAAPLSMASIPEIHTRFTVTAVTVSGIPAKRAATRVVLSVLQFFNATAEANIINHDRVYSGTLNGLLHDDSAMRAAIMSFNVPPNVPIAVPTR